MSESHPSIAQPDTLDKALDRIPASFDRFQEAHFWIHGMENYYHFSSQFRWHLNAFLKALKEVPQLLQMELQNEPGFAKWFREQREQLAQDPLIAHLFDQRDMIVHRDMLVPQSRCAVGVTEFRGMKLGVGFNINPLEDSDHLYSDFLADMGYVKKALPLRQQLLALEPFVPIFLGVTRRIMYASSITAARMAGPIYAARWAQTISSVIRARSSNQSIAGMTGIGEFC